MLKSTFAALILLLLAVPVPALSASKQQIVIGTGRVGGISYPAGDAICRLLNRSRKDHGIRCMVVSTAGSVYNLNAIRDGKLNFAIAKAADVDSALKGDPPFPSGRPFDGLRTVFTLYPKPFSLVTSANVSDFLVFNLVKSVFDNLDYFKKLHPAFRELQRNEMIKYGLRAQLHPGAARYYRQRGMMK